MSKRDSALTNISAPIVGAIYKSPFEGLDKHTEKIDECIKALRKCLKAYLKGDFEATREYAQQVSEIEHEADLIKANIRAHLPKYLFMSVSKSDFLNLLHNSDAILDYAEDVAVLLTMKDTKVPADIGKDILQVMDKVSMSVGAFQDVMSHMGVLVEVSFGGRERDRVKKFIKKIHIYEHESDIVERRVSQALLNADPGELDPISVFHLMKVVDRLGHIANKAENAGDGVRSMLAK